MFREQQMEEFRKAIEEKANYTKQYIDELSNQIKAKKLKEKKEREQQKEPVMVDAPKIKPQ